MLITYMNDERQPIRVRIMDARYNPATGKGDFFFTLNTCECKAFEVQLPPDSILYVKKWPGMVMLSWMPVSGLEHLGETLPGQQHQEQQGEELW